MSEGLVWAQFGPCLGLVWGLFGGCLGPLFAVCLRLVWALFGACLGVVWGLFGGCLGWSGTKKKKYEKIKFLKCSKNAAYKILAKSNFWGGTPGRAFRRAFGDKKVTMDWPPKESGATHRAGGRGRPARGGGSPLA